MNSRLVIPLVAMLITAGPVAGTDDLTPADVAVIVLDDFSPGIDPAAHDANANCANTGRGANEIETSGGGGGLPEGFSHGRAVYETLRRSLQDTGFTFTAPVDIPRDPLVPDFLTDWRHPGLGQRLLLLGMDTAGFDTGRIAADLQGTLAYLRTAFGVTRFVLNMSFVITPCDVPGWLAAKGSPLSDTELIAAYHRLVDRNPDADSLHRRIDELASSLLADTLAERLHRDRELREITQRVATNTFYELWTARTVKQLMQLQDLPALAYDRVTALDPLQSFLATRPFDAGVTSVGAAGNGVHAKTGHLIRINYPFAPAIWNTVVSTSALESGQRAGYSNSGEVILDGSATLPVAATAAARGVHGTSFAAPRLSARHALHLMRGHPTTCAAPGKAEHLPPLGYTDITAETETPQWNNLTLAAAVTTHCPPFPAT